MAYYIEIGAVELAGMDEDGEFIFQITDKAKEVAPELWQAHIEYVDESLMELFELGFIEVTYDENLEAHLNVSEAGKKLAKEMGLIETDFGDYDIPND
jgi:hypothetical protein